MGRNRNRDKEGAGEKKKKSTQEVLQVITSFMESSQETEETKQVVGWDMKGRRIKVEEEKCAIEQIGDREGDNDYLNTEKYGNKTLSLAALKTNGFWRKWCSCLSACPWAQIAAVSLVISTD